MNPVRRWFRFNLVGFAGMLVQLVTLSGLNHILRSRYLLTSSIAVETAILHNFVAHVHYTWRDRNLLRTIRTRRGRIALLAALWRFQVSNGGVSLAGTFVLMRLLVGAAHLPVLLANLISIAVCGLLNFWLGDRWAFAPQKRRPTKLTTVCCRAVAALLVILQVGMATAQETAPAPAALSPAAQKIKDDLGHLAPNAKLTVWMLNGIEYHGRLDAVEPDHFVLHEADLNQAIPLNFADVRALTPGYGGGHPGRRTANPLSKVVVSAAVLAGFFTLVIALVASDHS